MSINHKRTTPGMFHYYASLSVITQTNNHLSAYAWRIKERAICLLHEDFRSILILNNDGRRPNTAQKLTTLY